MLLALSTVALVKAGQGHPGSITPGWPWFNPFQVTDFSAFASGIILMVFIYWGWDTGVAVNEETKDRSRTPGLAAMLSTVILLVTYALVVTSIQAFAGTGATGTGLGNLANASDVLSFQGSAIFGSSGFGPVFTHLLLISRRLAVAYACPDGWPVRPVPAASAGRCETAAEAWVIGRSFRAPVPGPRMASANGPGQLLPAVTAGQDVRCAGRLLAGRGGGQLTFHSDRGA